MRHLLALFAALALAGCSGTVSSSSSSTTTGSSTTGTSSSSTGSSSTSGSSGSGSSGPCSGSPAFCDDFSSASHATDYVTRNGTWTRSIGSFEVDDANTWERARAVLANDVSDFDLTIVGLSLGDSGFGLVYNASATADDGYAVVLHPAQFQGVYLKRLNPGQQDTNLASYALPSQSPGTSHTLRVMRQGTTVTVWLDGAQVLQASDGDATAHGQLGFLESTTDQTSGAGARFSLLRVDSWSLNASGSSSGSTGSTGSSGNTGSSGSSGSSGSVDGGWVLTWSDEFDGGDNVPADPNKWENAVGGWGMGNQELEYYTAGTANVVQLGGNLVITARPNTDPSLTCSYPVNGNTCQYTSGKVTSQHHFSQQYGRFEARIKIPYGQGLWPAFWMLGDDIDTAGWPTCGEIDVMENIGREPNDAHGSLHAPGFDTGMAYTLPVPYSDDFHLFAVEWEPQVIRFYVDAALYETVDASAASGGTWEFDREPFFLLLNVAVGGSWPGAPDSTTVWPQQMLVDYVRVYARQ